MFFISLHCFKLFWILFSRINLYLHGAEEKLQMYETAGLK